MKNLSDPELFVLIQQQDDEKAFAVLLKRYEHQMYDLIYKRTRSDEDSRDIMQDIFISFWNNRHKINIEKTAFPYLYRSAKYAIIDLFIKNKKVIAFQSLLLKRDEPFSYSVEETMIAAELKKQYEDELAKMPPTMKKVYTLSREESMSAKEIAKQLELSEQTVRNNITLALQRLRLNFGSDQLITLLPIIVAFFKR